MRALPTLALALLSVVACNGGKEPDFTGTAGSAGSGGTAGEAGTDAGEDVANPMPLEGLGFDVTIDATDAGLPGCETTCSGAVLYVEHQSAGALDVIWGTVGAASSATLLASGTGWQLSEPLRLSTGSMGYELCAPSTDLTQGVFDFGDHDHDGAIDLVVSGHQSSKFCSEDTFDGSEGDLTMVGRPDTTAPSALGLDPNAAFYGAQVGFSEPLVPNASATLKFTSTGETIALETKTQSGVVVGAGTLQTLPLGASYTLEFTGTDLAGVGTPPLLSASTLADFGVLVPDGFESNSTTGLSSQAPIEIVDSYAGIPALSGTRMLHVAPGVPVMFRLQRTSSETALRLLARKLGDNCLEGSFSITVAVVGSTQRGSAALSLGQAAPADDAGTVVGDLQDVTVALPDSGVDVLALASGESHFGFGCISAGALLDDVRLE